MDVPRLIARPQGGLANRMRVITSFQTLARCSGRVFELCWAPSDGWSDEDLNILFENSFPRVPLDEFERYCHNGLALHEAVVAHGTDIYAFVAQAKSAEAEGENVATHFFSTLPQRYYRA